MGALILVLLIAAGVAAVMWNNKNAEAALDGVEFASSASPGDIVAAIAATYCHGAKAKTRSSVTRVKVIPSGPSTFRVETRIGDIGEIHVVPVEGSGAIVRAFMTELYVGTHPISHFRKGFYGVAAALAHKIYKLLDIAPNAGKLKRFQSGIQSRIGKQLSQRAAI